MSQLICVCPWTIFVSHECLCARVVCVWQKKKKKKAGPCQCGTSPKCLVVNCWGLAFGKQPNKRTLPVGQSKSAKQLNSAPRVDLNMAQTSPGGGGGAHTHTHLVHKMQITTLGTSCLPVKNTTLSAPLMTHTHTGTCMRRGEESQFDR